MHLKGIVIGDREEGQKKVFYHQIYSTSGCSRQAPKTPSQSTICMAGTLGLGPSSSVFSATLARAGSEV